jgi:hypothetical protein
MIRGGRKKGGGRKEGGGKILRGGSIEGQRFRALVLCTTITPFPFIYALDCQALYCINLWGGGEQGRGGNAPKNKKKTQNKHMLSAAEFYNSRRKIYLGTDGIRYLLMSTTKLAMLKR